MIRLLCRGHRVPNVHLFMVRCVYIFLVDDVVNFFFFFGFCFFLSLQGPRLLQHCGVDCNPKTTFATSNLYQQQTSSKLKPKHYIFPKQQQPPPPGQIKIPKQKLKQTKCQTVLEGSAYFAASTAFIFVVFVANGAALYLLTGEREFFYCSVVFFIVVLVYFPWMISNMLKTFVSSDF